MFAKLLIANRGEIAVRIMRTARRLGIRTVAVYSDADASSLHVEMADEAWRIGPAPAMQSYLNQDAIISAARASGADAIHPGYGFLSENPDFAEAVASAGLVFVGPPPAAIRAMGLKGEAKRLMEKAGVPVLPGYHGAEQDIGTLKREAGRMGYPVLLKPVAGGGGKGMRRVDSPDEIEQEIAASQREAVSAFGNGALLLEKFMARARHIEVQIIADAHGNVIHLFERDCSLQRRHQKIIEETPAPGLSADVREALYSAAIAAARAVGYVNAGTVEFLADISEGVRPDRIYFMEMNTRLQVEHPVTELATGLDLVEMQLRVAAGKELPVWQDDVAIVRHAIEARLYAEDPSRGFQPQTGRVTQFSFPSEPFLRIDTGLRAGDSVSSHYDPMIAKIIIEAPDRKEAVSRLAQVLAAGTVGGIRTNLGFLTRVLQYPQMLAGDLDTGMISRDLEELTAAQEPPMAAVSAALLLASGFLAEPASHSPFDTLAGFRLWGGESQMQRLAYQGRTLTCDLTRENGRFTATCGTQSLSFRILGFARPVLRIETDDRVLSFSVQHSDATVTVAFENILHMFEIAGGGDSVAESTEGSGLAVSPMPGQLRKLLVKAGDRVMQGAPVVVIEAMKMELTLQADRSGQVTEIRVAEGDQVAEGTVLLTIGGNDG